MTPGLFDGDESDRRKDDGMDRAANGKRAEDLAFAKRVAVRLAKERGEITIEDVHLFIIDSYPDWSPTVLGPSAGSVFKGDEWKFTGERRRSTYVKNHSRELKVWRYVSVEPI